MKNLNLYTILCITLIASNSLEATSLVRQAARAVSPKTLVKPAQWLAQTSFYKNHPWLCNTAGVIVAGVAAKKVAQICIRRIKRINLKRRAQFLKKSYKDNQTPLVFHLAQESYNHMHQVWSSGENQRANAHRLEREYNLKAALASGESIDSRDNNGNTPLMHVILSINGVMLLPILALNPDVNAQNNDGDTALILACRIKRYSDDSEYQLVNEFIKILIEHGADVNIRNNNNESALSAAIDKNYMFTQLPKSYFVVRLLEAGADITPEIFKELSERPELEFARRLMQDRRRHIITELDATNLIHGRKNDVIATIADYIIPRTAFS